jgi:hypothetical protein
MIFIIVHLFKHHVAFNDIRLEINRILYRVVHVYIQTILNLMHLLQYQFYHGKL